MIGLKFEPYSDSDKLADDAIEELNSLGLGYGAHTVIGMALGKLKAFEGTGLTPEEILEGKMLTGWIPVEEQLPYNSRAVLLCGVGGWQKVGWYERGHWWTGISHADIRDDVVAWMELPKPYRPEEDKP